MLDEIAWKCNKDNGFIPVCFPCVYIKRELINKIGLLDEDYIYYGFDDNDYCLKANEADYWTMITNKLYVKHGLGGAKLERGLNWSLSFARQGQQQTNEEIFRSKHQKKS
jgi:GT2 family glycosyltransferase